MKSLCGGNRVDPPAKFLMEKSMKTQNCYHYIEHRFACLLRKFATLTQTKVCI